MSTDCTGAIDLYASHISCSLSLRGGRRGLGDIALGLLASFGRLGWRRSFAIARRCRRLACSLFAMGQAALETRLKAWVY